MGRSINFAHFSGVKNHLLSPHILHMNCFLYPWTFLRAKKYLLVSCFQAGCRPLAPGSGDCEQCRLKLAATVLCTNGNRHTVRRRHYTRQLKCRYFMLFGKLCSVDIYMIINALLLWLCSGSIICVEVTNLSEHQKCMGVPHVSPTHGTSHTLSSTRCSCFVMV